MRTRTYLWLTLFFLVALTTWKLCSNKKELEHEAQLSKVTRAYVPVEAVQPQLETLANSLEADGIFLPAKEMFVISETAGRVLEVYKNKGEWVNEGEAAPKNKIEDIQLGILAAEAKEKGLKKQIEKTSITAPMTGTLGLRFIERGSVIGPGIQVAQMTNLEKLFLMVKVTERDVLNVKKGQNVRVNPDVYPGASISGRVTNVGLRADNAFTYDVEIEVVNPKNAPLRGGMHAKAVFTFDANRKGLGIPIWADTVKVPFRASDLML